MVLVFGNKWQPRVDGEHNLEVPSETLLFTAQAGLPTHGLGRDPDPEGISRVCPAVLPGPQLQGAGWVEQDLGSHPKRKDIRLDEHGLTKTLFGA